MTDDIATKDGRQLVKLLRSLASDQAWAAINTFGHGVVEIVTDDGRNLRVFGYDFGVNSSSSSRLADDKAATSRTLARFAVPAVDHRVVFRPDFVGYAGFGEECKDALSLFDEFGRNVVCKNNRGTGGLDVYHAKSEAELKSSIARIFSVCCACSISPFLDISSEIRVILIDDVVTAVYSKRRPSVVADGICTLAALIATHMPEFPTKSLMLFEESELAAIPVAGCSIALNWRHNLGQGAAPEFNISSSLRLEAIKLARAALRALDLRAASVDVIVVGGYPLVLEVNSGIMVENLSRAGDVGWRLARETYLRLVELAFMRQGESS